MTMLDVALAPAAKTGFYRVRSDPRWLEASSLGIPVRRGDVASAAQTRGE
jgi:hypothetical protein